MNRLLIALVGIAMLGACGGGPRLSEAARYDLGIPAAAGAAALPLKSLDVQSESWLSGSAMHYRLAYAEPLRRQSFLESRWAAPPGELLESFLKRRLVATGEGGGCRLHLALDDLEQRFDDAQRSQMALELRASVLAPRGGDILARRAFRIQKVAATADARGGAAAAREAAQALGDELGAWIEELARARPALGERCRT